MSSRLPNIKSALIVLLAISIFIPMYKVTGDTYNEVNGLHTYSQVYISNISYLILAIIILGAFIRILDYKVSFIGRMVTMLFSFIFSLSIIRLSYTYLHELHEEYYVHIDKYIGYYLLVGIPLLLIIISCIPERGILDNQADRLNTNLLINIICFITGIVFITFIIFDLLF